MVYNATRQFKWWYKKKLVVERHAGIELLFAEAFSMWTEGIHGVKWSKVKEIMQFLTNGEFSIPEEIPESPLGEKIPTRVRIGTMEKRYGGRVLELKGFGVYPLVASQADHVANMQGYKMWKELFSTKQKDTQKWVDKFDICDWVVKEFQEFGSLFE